MTSTIKISILSLGCSKNLVDSEEILGDLYQRGFQLVAEPEQSDVVIVNTCGFIQSAIDEGHQTLQEIVELKNGDQVKKVYAFGCLVSRQSEVLKEKIPLLDGVYALNERDLMLEHVGKGLGVQVAEHRSKGLRPVSATLSHYSYLKISEGCERTCTFCTIPSIRGLQIDKPMEDLVKEARELVSRGVKEINLIAQDTTAYGRSLYKKPQLLRLLKNLDAVEGLEWIRLHYAYPEYIEDDLADFLVKAKKVLPYLDLPIQHVSASILKRMNRGGTFKIFDALFNRLREKMPTFCLRTTVIVGFPGETEEDFTELLNYIKDRKFDRLGAFKYFQEEGTPAFRMSGQVPKEVIDERYDRLMKTQQENHLKKNEELIGQSMMCLIDEVDEEQNFATARSWRDAVGIDSLVFIDGGGHLKAGAMAEYKITDSVDYDLEAKI